MRTFTIAVTLILLLLQSCSQNATETPELKEYVAIINNEGAGAELMSQLFELTNEGTQNCYKDAELQNPFDDIFEAHASKEVIQIPSGPGEFKDTTIVTRATRESFHAVHITGQFNGNQLSEIKGAVIHYKLIVDGIDLGSIASIYVNPEVLNQSTVLKKGINSLVQADNLELLTAEELEQKRTTGEVKSGDEVKFDTRTGEFVED